MRLRSSPASGSSSGSTFSASVPLPVGASHSSQASPSTISPSRLPTANRRDQATAAGRVVRRAGASGLRSSLAMMPAMNSPPTRHATAGAARRTLRRRCRPGPGWRHLQTLRQRFREDRLGLTASSLTFTTLIALVPLVTVMLAVFSAFPMFEPVPGCAAEVLPAEPGAGRASRSPVLLALTQFAGQGAAARHASAWCCWC